MTEPTTTDLRIAIAELSGKVTGYQEAAHLEMSAIGRRLDDHVRTAEREQIEYEAVRDALRDRIATLERRWAYVWGIGGGVSLVATVLSLYAVLHGSGVHF